MTRRQQFTHAATIRRAMKSSRVCRPALAIMALLAGLGGTAQAQEYLPKLGSAETGAPFSTPCDPTMILAGFELRAGLHIDAVRPVCVTAFEPRNVSPPSPASDWKGGSGGAIVPLLCPAANPIVRGLLLQYIPYGEI